MLDDANEALLSCAGLQICGINTQRAGRIAGEQATYVRRVTQEGYSSSKGEGLLSRPLLLGSGGGRAV
jgi:hypothetical protein